MANSWQSASEATWWKHLRNVTFTNMAIAKESCPFHSQQGSDQSFLVEFEGGLGQETQIRASRVLPGQITYRPHHNSAHHHWVAHQCSSLYMQHSWILRRLSKFVQRNLLKAGTPPPKKSRICPDCSSILAKCENIHAFWIGVPVLWISPICTLSILLFLYLH